MLAAIQCWFGRSRKDEHTTRNLSHICNLNCGCVVGGEDDGDGGASGQDEKLCVGGAGK